jgi:hypothetical protein
VQRPRWGCRRRGGIGSRRQLRAHAQGWPRVRAFQLVWAATWMCLKHLSASQPVLVSGARSAASEHAAWLRAFTSLESRCHLLAAACCSGLRAPTLSFPAFWHYAPGDHALGSFRHHTPPSCGPGGRLGPRSL